MLRKMLISHLFFTVFLLPLSEGLTGGTKLSSPEIANNIYGVGLFPATNGKSCICIWVIRSFCFHLIDVCGRFGNPADNKTITIMGKELKASPNPIAPGLCNGYTTGYQEIYLSEEVPATEVPPSPRIAPNLAHSVPPSGTECQVVGYSGTYPAPNKIEVKVVDFKECKMAWAAKYAGDAALMKPQRHFCAYLKKQNDPSPIKELDFVAPIYCKSWWETETKFWKPFGNADDEEDDDDVKPIPYAFAGFQFLTKDPQDVPIVFEGIYCT